MVRISNVRQRVLPPLVWTNFRTCQQRTGRRYVLCLAFKLKSNIFYYLSAIQLEHKYKTPPAPSPGIL